jgi:hypothetical protein
MENVWADFNALVQRHERRAATREAEIHDGWLYCWCDEAKAVRAASETLPPNMLIPRAGEVRTIPRELGMICRRRFR